MAKKKGNKKRVIVWMIVVLFLALIIWRLVTPKVKSMDEATVVKGDITTYYNFGGNIEAKNRSSVIADRMMQIKEIKVTEGQQVKVYDVLFITTLDQEIKATMDGEVVKIMTEENAQVMAGSKLMDVVDYDNLQITVKVDEYDVNAIAIGKDVTVNIEALNQEISGKVASISKEATVANGVSFFTAIIDLPQDRGLKVGMTAEVKILNESVTGVPTISMKAVQFDAVNEPFAYVKLGKKKFEKAYITVGINDGEIVEVKEGLNVGDIFYIPKTVATGTRFMGPRRAANQSNGGQ